MFDAMAITLALYKMVKIDNVVTGMAIDLVILWKTYNLFVQSRLAVEQKIKTRR